MSLRSLLLVSAVCVAGGASAQQPTMAEDAAQLAESHMAGAKCGWLAPLDVEVLRLARDEQLAMVEIQAGAAMKTSTATGAAQRGAAAAAKPCTGAAADAAKAKAQGMAQSLRFRMLLRADAMSGMTDYWAYELTTTNSHREALHAGAEALRQGATAAGQGAQFGQLAAQAQGEAAAAVNLICTERKNTRSMKGPRPCPAVAPTEQAALPYARALVASAEAFAPLYAAALKAEQQAQAATAAKAQADKAQAAAAAETARKKAVTAATDKATAQYGDLKRYYRPTVMANLYDGDADAPSECSASDALLDLGGPTTLKAGRETMTLFYAPTVALDKSKPATWALYSQSMAMGSRGKVVELVKLDTNGFDDESIRAAFKPIPADTPSWSSPVEALYLQELEMRALAASIDGVAPSRLRQCRGK